jgi:hypothetical protein
MIQLNENRQQKQPESYGYSFATEKELIGGSKNFVFKFVKQIW